MIKGPFDLRAEELDTQRLCCFREPQATFQNLRQHIEPETTKTENLKQM
jgi:hypothetical protein